MRELGGFDYSTAFSVGSVVALILGGIALLVVRHSTVRSEGKSAIEPSEGTKRAKCVGSEGGGIDEISSATSSRSR